jgi:type IV pilus assembly protein PilO
MAGLDIENRPWYVALLIGIVIAGLLIFACENYVFKDIEKSIVVRTNDLEVLKKKVQEGKIAESRLTQFREEAERLETELQRLLRILPTLKQTDELIKKLKSLTERGNFRMVSFQPQGLFKKEFYSEWPINVQLQASYHELALFFDRLSRFSRIINVETLQAAANTRKGSDYTIGVSFTMKTFIYGEIKEVKQEGARR